MKQVLLSTLMVAIQSSLLTPASFAADTDGDGLLDLIDVSGFDPSASGGASFERHGIEDLDGAALLTDLQWLLLQSNQITSIESGDFQGLSKLQWLALDDNQIASIESGAFDGLMNLRTLDLSVNQITSLESDLFQGLTSLNSLFLGDNALTELNFTGATFDRLLEGYVTKGRSGEGKQVEDADGDERCCSNSGRSIGFFVDGSPIFRLILNDAVLSPGSLDAIVSQTQSISDVSLVGLTFTGENPTNLNKLLGIGTLDNVKVDPSLFSLYANEFTAFAAIDGNAVTVVPEPASSVLLLAAVIGIVGRRRSLEWANGDLGRRQHSRRSRCLPPG